MKKVVNLDAKRISRLIFRDAILRDFIESNSQYYLFDEKNRVFIVVFDRIGLEDFVDDMVNLKRYRIVTRITEDLKTNPKAKYFIYIFE
ncbi:MAG: hypothetical protein N2202_10165 [Proteobacteria bacterium]|nr:hypothetical protein [Pseudomonadota bacterium]